MSHNAKWDVKSLAFSRKVSMPFQSALVKLKSFENFLRVKDVVETELD